MSTDVAHLQFVGQQPSIVGQCCSGLIVQHFYDGVTLTDRANVVFLRFQDTWHRIWFETATVFWRSGDPPQQPVDSTLEHGLLLNDLSELHTVVGRVLRDIAYSATENGDVSVRFLFEGGTELSLRYENNADVTHIDA
jgi:hypothetical protein